MKKFILRLLFLFIGLFTLTNLFVFDIFQVSGVSMEPTLHSGDIVVAVKLTFCRVALSQDDIVVFNHDSLASIKRIAASENQKVIYDKSTLYVDGKSIRTFPSTMNFENVVVPENSYYLLGDNFISIDSRQFGCISKHDILSKVLLIFRF